MEWTWIDRSIGTNGWAGEASGKATDTQRARFKTTQQGQRMPASRVADQIDRGGRSWTSLMKDSAGRLKAGQLQGPAASPHRQIKPCASKATTEAAAQQPWALQPAFTNPAACVVSGRGSTDTSAGPCSWQSAWSESRLDACKVNIDGPTPEVPGITGRLAQAARTGSASISRMRRVRFQVFTASTVADEESHLACRELPQPGSVAQTQVTSEMEYRSTKRRNSEIGIMRCITTQRDGHHERRP